MLLDNDLVAIGVFEDDGLFKLLNLDVLVVEVTGGAAKIVGLQRHAGVGAERGGGDFDIIAGVAGQVPPDVLAGERLELKVVEVKVFGGSWVDHGEGDAEESVGYPVRA